MKCEFCGCTERKPCAIAFRVFYAEDDGSAGVSPLVDCDDQRFLETGLIQQLDHDIEYEPCRWIARGLCSAPACVEKAYAAMRPVAEKLQAALDLGLIELREAA